MFVIGCVVGWLLGLRMRPEPEAAEVRVCSSGQYENQERRATILLLTLRMVSFSSITQWYRTGRPASPRE